MVTLFDTESDVPIVSFVSYDDRSDVTTIISFNPVILSTEMFSSFLSHFFFLCDNDFR